MALMGLPGTDLNQLRKQAKDWLRRVAPATRRPSPCCGSCIHMARNSLPTQAGCGWRTPSSR